MKWYVYSVLVLFAPIAHADETQILLGAVSYPGGFVQNAQLQVSPPRAMRYLRVAIPSFCPDVEVLEARTVSGGFSHLATLVDKQGHLYSIDAVPEERVSAVVLSLNGPAGSPCSIPLYASAQPPPEEESPAVGGNEVQLCNLTNSRVSAALVFSEAGAWISQGWWRLAPGECQAPATSTPILGTFYYYAFSDSGLAWGSGPLFCIKLPGNFKTSGTSCSDRPGYRTESFTQSYRDAGTLHRVQFSPN